MFRRRVLRGDHFSGRPWRDSPFQKGDLKYVILDLIKDKPRYGYEIIRALEERSHGFYTPSPGTVYPTLQMLEEMGYASATEQDGKKVYTITEEGRAFLSERKDVTDEVRSQMKRRWDPGKIGKIVLVMKEFHAIENLLGRRLRRMQPEKLQRIREVLVRAGQEIEAILEE
jgi:DNA-binding PadR family transcriptional regulator